MAIAFLQTPHRCPIADPTACSRSGALQPGLRRQQRPQVQFLRQQPAASRTALRAAVSAVAAAKPPQVEKRAPRKAFNISPETAEDLYRFEKVCDKLANGRIPFDQTDRKHLHVI